MDLFVLPIMSLLYLMNGIDRSNVGNAAVSRVGSPGNVACLMVVTDQHRLSTSPRTSACQPMQSITPCPSSSSPVSAMALPLANTNTQTHTDTRRTDQTSADPAVIIFQPISSALGKAVGVKYWMPFLMVSWGLFTLAHAYVKSEGELIAFRLMVGV
jgi:hypothetical protein